MTPRPKRAGGRGWLIVVLLLVGNRPILAQPPLCPSADQWSAGRVATLAALGPSGSVLSWLPTINAGGTVVEGIAFTMLNGVGGTAAGWESGPTVFPESALTAIPRMVAISGGAFMLTWDRYTSGGLELSQIWAVNSGGVLPSPALLRDTVLSGAGMHLGTAELIASDSNEAFIATGEPTGLVVRKLGLGKISASVWPSSGVALGQERQLGGMALDDSGGVYVADCQLVPCFMPTDDCTTTVRVRRVLADGTFDPRWGKTGRVLASALPSPDYS